MSENHPASSRFFHISTAGKLRKLDSQNDALALLDSSGYVWFDFVDPSREELASLIEPLKLHPLSIEDCLDEDQVPKIDDFPSQTFILFNRYLYSDHTLTIDEIDYFLGKKYLVSVTHDHGGNNVFFPGLEQAVTRESLNVRKGPDFLLHVFLDVVVDEKFRAIEALGDELDEAEEAAIENPSLFKPEVLLRLRRNLLTLRKSLYHEREILVRVSRRDSPFISESAIYHYRDIYDHLAKFFEAIEINREMITNLMEMHLSILNNRMTIVANRTNRIVRRLTLINTIFMPLTLLAGIGGMSEWSMMTGPNHWKIAYPAFMFLMLGVAVVNYFVLKRLESRERKKAEKDPMGLDED